MKKVPQSGQIVKVNYDTNSQTALVKQRERIVPKLTITIKNQTQLDAAVEMAKLAEQWIENASAFVDPVVKATDAAHKAAVKLRKELTSPVAGPLGILKTAIFNFIAEQGRIQRQAQLDADAEQERINREAAEKAAKAATKAGADKETVAEIRDNVLATAAPLVRSKVQAPADVSTRTTYDVDREDFDLYALAVAIAKLPKTGNHLLELIEPNFVNLRARAVAGKETAVIPGFKVVTKTGGSIR
jgi:multidrug efflux pump subunit AcrA (membrane-fusion protein)